MKGFRFGVFRLRLGLSRGSLSSECPPVIIFLNGKGGGQHSLKVLIVEDQIGSAREHGIRGITVVETEAIVVQVCVV